MARLMQAGQEAALYAITYPTRKYRKFQEYRHRRIRDEPGFRSRGFWKSLHPSLKEGYRWCLVLVASTWVICIALAVWIGVGHKAETGLVYTLQTGSCNAIREANFWIHLLINGVASSVYAVSSYVMQRLAAPTREDIDRAHADRQPLKIGTLATTNFALLSKRKLAVFALLWGSSLPLHLMFNSLIVYTSTNAEWASEVFMLEEGAFEKYQANRTVVEHPGLRDYSGITGGFNGMDSYGSFDAQYILHQQPPLVEMVIEDCIQIYGSGPSETWGDIILLYPVTQSTYRSVAYSIKDTRFTSNLPSKGNNEYLPNSNEDPWEWMCDYTQKGPCDAEKILAGGRWVLNDETIIRCLARQLPDQRELNTSLPIMIAVLICISFKLLAIVLAVFLGRAQSLLTIGDAVSSFLHRPDELVGIRVTKCTTSDRRTKFLHGQSCFWWAFIFGLVGAGLAWGFFGYTFRETNLAYANSKTTFDLGTMLSFGLGNMPGRWTGSLVRSIMGYGDALNVSFSYTSGAVLANLPQLALSGFYLLYNNYITRIFIAMEYRSFSTRRRGLRVSEPLPNSFQRPAHFLQIPLRYSLAHIAIFALMHTFLSQALFLRRVYAIWPQSFDDPTDIGKFLVPMLGYSPVAAFAFAICMTAVLFLGLAIALVKFDRRMFEITGDSMSLAAACHPPEGTEKTHEGKVRWGVTKKHPDGTVDCSFSLLPVRPPDVGDVVAGVPGTAKKRKI